MKSLRALPAILLALCITQPNALAMKAEKGSSEDLYWTEPMTVHDYKKNSDLHNISVSIMAMTELEFVRLADGLYGVTLRTKKRPLSQSLDSLDYAYRKLPRIEPIRRFGQLFDALQLRQLSLSDARTVGVFMSGQGMGGVTPIMQVRIYKLLVWLEDVIYDIDETAMFPINYGVSRIRKEPTKIKTFSYAADGIGAARWEFFAALNVLNREMVRIGSKIITTLEAPKNSSIRRKLKKQNRHKLIYSRMPIEVFRKNQSFLISKDKNAFAGTLGDWHQLMLDRSQILPPEVRQDNIPVKGTWLTDLPATEVDRGSIPVPGAALSRNPSNEVLVAADYGTWEKVPAELKHYVIAPEELAALIRQYEPPAEIAERPRTEPVIPPPVP
ncbi:MAG TPA: hypothetical protein PLL75_07685 [Candidatus Omnitrophota bacterium]|nr:hypothetical protein [Candidatus Omnitrophota bacterium]HPS37588.1 hypothetical protein [Candidatus Omnitrophota bacterium]